jgi:hypothetical protein
MVITRSPQNWSALSAGTLVVDLDGDEDGKIAKRLPK